MWRAFIFPGLDHILALAQPGPQELISSLSNALWLLKMEFTGQYASILEEQFQKIRNMGGRTLSSSIHRAEAVLTVLCNGKRPVFNVSGMPYLRRACYENVPSPLVFGRP